MILPNELILEAASEIIRLSGRNTSDPKEMSRFVGELYPGECAAAALAVGVPSVLRDLLGEIRDWQHAAEKVDSPEDQKHGYRLAESIVVEFGRELGLDL